MNNTRSDESKKISDQKPTEQQEVEEEKSEEIVAFEKMISETGQSKEQQATKQKQEIIENFILKHDADRSAILQVIANVLEQLCKKAEDSKQSDLKTKFHLNMLPKI